MFGYKIVQTYFLAMPEILKVDEHVASLHTTKHPKSVFLCIKIQVGTLCCELP